MFPKYYSNETVFTDALDRLQKIKAIVFDFDGVLTNNTEAIGFADKSIVKFRSHYDGQGISLLRAIGLRVAIATNEKEGNAVAAEFLATKWNNLPSVKEGKWHEVKLFTGVAGEQKVEAINAWFNNFGISWNECAVMGDDLVDVPMLSKAGFKAAPSTGEYVVRSMADFVSIRPAGNGAVRDLANFILHLRNIDPTKLPTQ